MALNRRWPSGTHSNEPDYNAAKARPAICQQKRFEIARLIAATLHELDKKTPVTIGVAYERNMETLADAVDVLSFHDYLPTRAAISNDIVRAKAFAAKSGKQVMDTETGCIARANPYDVTLEEHAEGQRRVVYLGTDDLKPLGRRSRSVLSRRHGSRPGDSRGDARLVP